MRNHNGVVTVLANCFDDSITLLVKIESRPIYRFANVALNEYKAYLRRRVDASDLVSYGLVV